VGGHVAGADRPVRMILSRHASWPGAIALACATAPLAAQADSPSPTTSQTIDIRVPPRREEAIEDCSEDQEAASITGEIVVCRRRGSDQGSGWDKEAWENRYAAETRGRDPVDVGGPGIFRGKPTVSGLCVPGLQKCPPPPAYFIDFDALPETPPGSDADRIARGLPPRGRDDAQPRPTGPASNGEELGLPPPPEFVETEEVGRPGSEGPAAPR
jgi:hypothetical protein